MIKKNLASSESLLLKISHSISHYTGIYFPKENLRELEIKLRPAAHVFEFDDTQEFLEWLSEAKLTQKQISTLVGFITIGETYFFRDAHFFDILEHSIFPKLIESKKKCKKLTIWSTACCTGEEPYSIAIILHKLRATLKDWEISIIGTDINPFYIEKAKTGLYKEWSFRSTPPLIKSNYFIKNPEGRFQLIPEIREMVKFFPLNLMDDTYPSILTGLINLDLIICNNVLIYFSMAAIHKCVRQLTNCLSDTGLLAVTPIEAPYINDSRLSILKYDYTTFFCKNSSEMLKNLPSFPEPSHGETSDVIKIELPSFLNLENPILEVNFKIPPMEKTSLPPKPDEHPTNQSHQKKLLDEALHLELEGKHEEKIELFEKALSLIKNKPNELVKMMSHIKLLIKMYGNSGKIQEALDWCEIALNIEKNPDLYYMQALILEDANDNENAVKSLKKALNLDHNFAMCQFGLANLYEKELNHEAALQHYKNAFKLIQNLDEDSLLEEGDGMTAGQMRAIIQGIIPGLSFNSRN